MKAGFEGLMIVLTMIFCLACVGCSASSCFDKLVVGDSGRLVANGILFTDAQSGSAVCTPTRYDDYLETQDCC